MGRPSEDLLFELLTDIEDGLAESRLVVTRMADPNETTFGRVTRHHDGRYDVEYRDGGPDMWATTAADMREAHRLLTAWAHQLLDKLANERHMETRARRALTPGIAAAAVPGGASSGALPPGPPAPGRP